MVSARLLLVTVTSRAMMSTAVPVGAAPAAAPTPPIVTVSSRVSLSRAF
jgi:hypothetical protein